MTYRDEVHGLPEHMREGVLRYIEHGILTGGFLRAVVENDLRGAFMAADDINEDRMLDFAAFFHNEAPNECFGSPELVARWMAAGGLAGMRAMAAAQKTGSAAAA